MTDVLRVVSERKTGISEFPVTPVHLAEMIALIQDGTISGKMAKDLFEEMLATGDEPKAIVRRKGLVQVSDSAAIEQAVDRVLASNRPQVEKYASGTEKLFGFFVGETMKVMKGKGNPTLVNDVLKKKLGALRK